MNPHPHSILIDGLAKEWRASREEVLSMLGKFEVIPFEHNGEVTLYIVLAGNEVHLWSRPECRGRCLTRHKFADFSKRLLDERGYLTTRIPIGTPARDRTGERLGFTWTWRDERFDYYIKGNSEFLMRNSEFGLRNEAGRRPAYQA
jgi:hypothetical protein